MLSKSKIGHFTRRKRQQQDEGEVDPNSCTNLFAACLPRWLDNTQLYEIFAQFEPTNATIMMDVNTGRSKGFGFVLFRSTEDGYRALSYLNGRLVSCGGTTFSMYVSPSKFNGASACTESTRVYLRNIPMSMASDDIVQYFSRHGAIKNIEMRPDDRDSSWLVTLEFYEIAAARLAIARSHGKLLFPAISQIPVMAKYEETAETKIQRKQKKMGDVAPSQPPAYDDVCGTSDTVSHGSTPHEEDSDAHDGDCRRFRHDPYTPCGVVMIP